MLTRVFEAYIYAGRVLGNERAHLPPTQSIRGFEHAYDFRGKSAHIIVVSNDPGVSRDIALEFATAIATERVKRFSVSFDQINSETKRLGYYARKSGRK